MDLAELLTVETSVLQALCMSTGSESTELRDTILRELEQDDFYFPITRTIYAAVSSMSRDNSPVDAESLLRALSRRSVDIPDDFFLEDLFTGAKPSKETLAGWLNGVKNGEEKEADAQTKPKTQPKVAPPTKPTLADTHRSVKVTFPPPLERNGYDEAAGSLREGMEETLTVLKLALPELLRRSLATTNSIENLNGTIRRVSRNVKRWKSPSMIRRWTALGVVTAEKKFRRIKGYRNMGALVHALKSKQKSLDSDEFAA